MPTEASFGCFAEEMTDFEVGEKGLAKGFRADRCRWIESVCGDDGIDDLWAS